MAGLNVPPTIVTYEGEAKSRVERGPEKGLSAIPTIAIPFLLPILIPLWIFFRIRRRLNRAAILQEELALQQEAEESRESALSALCSGSGRAASDTDTNCTVCGNQIGVSAGRFMTHS